MNDEPVSMSAAESKNSRHYVLVCVACGRTQVDDGIVLTCPENHPPALLRTQYMCRQFAPLAQHEGISRYQDWLPVDQARDGGQGDDVGRSVVYRSEGLARHLGTPDLWIAFNGHWPERSAFLPTATFKDFEAFTVLRRLPGRQVILTVASSGNTGAAFASACSSGGQPCLLIVPARGLSRFRFRTRVGPAVRLVVIEDGDYPDAIDLAAAMCRIPPFQTEGGIRNVGRRDGLATVLLSAFEQMGRLPAHYVQAVGSGTGAIAVFEASKRVQSAVGGAELPRLMLCQNLPFAPIYDAWHSDHRSLPNDSGERFRDTIPQVHADELTNWRPPYDIPGGIYDSLKESQGDVLVADNQSVLIAIEMFRKLEGIDIEPASGVAVACLADAVSQGKIDMKSSILLNVTGGGRNRLREDRSLIPAEPTLWLTREALARADVVHRVADVCVPDSLAV
jgi:cysteate synthase